MQKWSKHVFILLILLIPILVYLISFSSIVYNKPFIEKQMEKAGLFMYSKEINSYVVQYLADPGETELIKLDVFNEKEQKHLLDVKVLVHRVFDALFLLLALFFALVYCNHKSSKSRNWGKILVYSGMITAAVPLLLYFIPFELLFVSFHNIFFSQGSWVFSPGSALIEIYPFEFWYNVSFGFFLRSAIAGWLLIIIGLYALRKKLLVV